MNGIFDDDTLLGGEGNDLLRDPSHWTRIDGGPGIVHTCSRRDVGDPD